MRALALASHTPYDPVSLENTDFNSRAALKSRTLITKKVIGDGVTKFKFRLLPSVWDHNYDNIDSGERHVFQVDRVDGSSALLHFHTGGDCDFPEIQPSQNVVPSSAAISEDAGTAYSRLPAIQYDGIRNHVYPGEKSAPLGKTEAAMALQSILIAAFGKSGDGAVNVTDEVAIQWMRVLKNHQWCQEYVGPGIERAYAARLSEDTMPVLVVCRSDSSYVILDPSKRKLHATTHSAAGGVWQNLTVLQNAKYFDNRWMKIRAELAFPRQQQC